MRKVLIGKSKRVQESDIEDVGFVVLAEKIYLLVIIEAVIEHHIQS